MMKRNVEHVLEAKHRGRKNISFHTTSILELEEGLYISKSLVSLKLPCVISAMPSPHSLFTTDSLLSLAMLYVCDTLGSLN